MLRDQRTVRCAARRPIDELFDDLALHMGMTAHRVDATSLLLDAPGVFISACGRRKIDYGSLTFDFWADTLQRLECARDRMLRLVGEQLARREMFTIDCTSTRRRDCPAPPSMKWQTRSLSARPTRRSVNRWLLLWRAIKLVDDARAAAPPTST